MNNKKTSFAALAASAALLMANAPVMADALQRDESAIRACHGHEGCCAAEDCHGREGHDCEAHEGCEAKE